MSSIRSSSLNPRKTFDEEPQAELVASVKTSGILVPLILRVVPEGFEVVAGERRFRAAGAVGLTEVPAVVRNLSDQEALEIALLENLQRADVRPQEEAEAMQALVKSGAYTVDTLAQKLGKSRSHVYGRLAMLEVGPEVAEALGQGFIPPSVVGVLTPLPASEQAKLVAAAMNAKPGEAMSAREFKKFVTERSEAKRERSAEAQRRAEAKRELGQKEARKRERELKAVQQRKFHWLLALVPRFKTWLKEATEAEFLVGLHLANQFEVQWHDSWPLKAERNPNAAARKEWLSWSVFDLRWFAVVGDCDEKQLGHYARKLERIALVLGETYVDPQAEPEAKPAKSKRSDKRAVQTELLPEGSK